MPPSERPPTESFEAFKVWLYGSCGDDHIGGRMGWSRHSCPECHVALYDAFRALAAPPNGHDGTTHWVGCGDTRGHHACAIAELETTRTDKERLDDLHQLLIDEMGATSVRVVVGESLPPVDGIPVQVLVFTINGEIGYESLREAIDALRAARQAQREGRES